MTTTECEEPQKCERCGYDDIETTDIPEYFQDRYQGICKECQKQLCARQAKMADWGEY